MQNETQSKRHTIIDPLRLIDISALLLVIGLILAWNEIDQIYLQTTGILCALECIIVAIFHVIRSFMTIKSDSSRYLFQKQRNTVRLIPALIKLAICAFIVVALFFTNESDAAFCGRMANGQSSAKIIQ